LNPEVKFSNTCDWVHIKVLTNNVGGQYNSDETYIITKDGNYYLNSKCDKGYDKGWGYSYINIYDVIKITDGKMGC